MAAEFTLPESFRFGVATSGFQVEGGFNGPGEPANNWWGWEAAGRVEPSGKALDFWNRYEDHLDRAAAAGCDAFRLSVEWARVEQSEGQLDTSALDRYAAILDACHERGLRPLVTLLHFTHPMWLGEEFWLRADAPERFAAWARLAAGHLGTRCRHWVTINELNVLAVASFLLGAFPPGRRLATGATVRALDHLLTAHVLAYGAIHSQQPDAVVSTNTNCVSAYELDPLLLDILLARSCGVGRHDLRPWLAERQAAYYSGQPLPSRLERILRRATAANIPLEQALPRAVSAVYASSHDCTLDVVQIDYYSPQAREALRLPGRRGPGGREWQPMVRPWEQRVDPQGLGRWLRLHAESGLPIEVAENGMCNRVRRGRSFPRSDGWDRVRYLRAHLRAVVDAIEAGIPLAGYYHWTLADNYEWGSYEPRFGLFAVDRERGLRWSDRDAMGGDAAGTYREIAKRLRDGDRSAVA